MTDWLALQATAAAAIVDQAAFGVPALYRAAGTGNPIALQAIDTPEAQAVGQSGFVEIRHEIHIARTAPVNPARGDTLTLGDATFFVQQHEPDGPFWRLIVRQGGS
ncbi:head-tail joining protein [Thiocystis violacea]|uniref:head-tail joining protein n=1 Tax=Thiocystis violacea TaxID=13725 RepID=UPI00190646F6|nr:hypothetical protein [Thiocystis violacea]MBK1719224.1 hypothetical protein [Thiocystis violacea]